MIALDGVVKKVSDGFALQDLTFEVSKGSTLALFGPSGCGKTTTLRLIAGFEQLDAGEIRINNRRVSTPRKMAAPHSRGVGMVFQDLALWPHMDVQAHLNFVLDGQVKDRQERTEKIREILRRVQLGARINDYPYQLSGGEKQRLAMARALVATPEVLLMDEPLSSLDAHLRSALLRQTRDLIRELGMTTVYVTHDWHEALFLADIIAIMKDGAISKIIKADDANHNASSAAALDASDVVRKQHLAAG